MNLRWRRLSGAVLAGVAGALAFVMLAASPAAASPILFCGAGRALTADVAIQSALWDAENSAQSMGFYGPCTIVGDPFLAQVKNDPLRGTYFLASVNATCAQ